MHVKRSEFELEKVPPYPSLQRTTASPRGPVFMTLIEKTFGKNVTTRTWETIGKLAK